MSPKYIFKSERLGFRVWTKEDLHEFGEINADKDVMEHFPRPLTTDETDEFLDRLIAHYDKHGYQYFATEILETTEGAERCLEFAFEDLHLKKVFSACTKNNLKSENIMRKIGMAKMGEFNHPNLKEYPELEKCVWYEVTSYLQVS